MHTDVQIRRFFVISIVLLLITALCTLVTVAGENTRRLTSGEKPRPADFSAFSQYADIFFDFS